MEYTTLSNGVKMPMLGYGVFQIGNAETEECVSEAIKAVEEVDAQVGKVVDATLSMGGIAMVTASHGNVERMLDAEGHATGRNTDSRVPFILCGAGTELREGRLADVAPTILDVLGLVQPPEMTGKTLIVR